MSYRTRSFLIVSGLLMVVGCSNIPPASLADLNGANALTTVSNFVFVTSTARNELRVLNLNGNKTDFVRAPNPLEPLSIPVIPQPTALTADIGFDAAGTFLAGQYVFAGATASTISVVKTDPTRLAQQGLVQSAGGIITALAARYTPSLSPNVTGASVLYYASYQQGALGHLDGSVVWAAAIVDGQQVGAPTMIAQYPNASVQGILTLPNQQLAVATRSSGLVDAKVYLYPSSVGNVAPSWTLTLPVRQLYTHEASVNSPAGTFIYAVLDEEFCPSPYPSSFLQLTDCRGVVALSAATGKVQNKNQAPLNFGKGSAQGVTVVPSGQILTSTLTSTPDTKDLLGVATGSDGEINFFDATSMDPVIGPTTGQPVQITLDLAIGTFRYPAGVVYNRANGANNSALLYIAYPSANAMVQLDPTHLIPNVPNGSSNVVTVFR